MDMPDFYFVYGRNQTIIGIKLMYVKDCRICLFCRVCTEYEFHVLCQCLIYDELRKSIYRHAIINDLLNARFKVNFLAESFPVLSKTLAK